jgi:hypothetical protein
MDGLSSWLDPFAGGGFVRQGPTRGLVSQAQRSVRWRKIDRPYSGRAEGRGGTGVTLCNVSVVVCRKRIPVHFTVPL